MKTLKNIQLLIIALLTIMGTACYDDFLDVKPTGVADPSSWYQTEEETAMALIACYDFIQSDLGFGWSSLFFTKQLPSDGTNCGGGGESDQEQYQKIDDFKWDTENAGITAYFQLLYYGINRCNALIENVQPGTAFNDDAIAQAKFLRAYFYFELTIAFGDVPLRLTEPKSLTDGVARAPQAEVYAQIEKDLNEAIAVLPNKGDAARSGADAFRANKQAAQALLGKAHLYQGDYSDALTQFNLVIAREGNDVGLESDFAQISRISTEWGQESLFEVSFVSENKNWGTVFWDRRADDNRHIQLSGPRDFGAANGGSIGINGGWGFMPPTMKLYNAFDAADPRRLNTVVTSQELIDIYGGTGFNDGWDTEGCIRSKYTTFAEDTNGENGNTPELNYGTNWRLIRYSDVLLMAAEAANRGGGTDAYAQTQLNKLRTRAGYTTPVTATGDALFQVIKNERWFELAYEGHRYWDLVRWGDHGTELAGTPNFDATKHALFPIPQQEINGNPGISAADQNPGYN